MSGAYHVVWDADNLCESQRRTLRITGGADAEIAGMNVADAKSRLPGARLPISQDKFLQFDVDGSGEQPWRVMH